MNNPFLLKYSSNNDVVIALAGNPNTGKSTIFNALTGLRQHTGNWPGKTVTSAQGHYVHKEKTYLLVDLPGTYSLHANSPDEQIARDFILFGRPKATVVVTDATNLERNLNLALQIMEATNKVILCVNLLDEAERKGIVINLEKLSTELGIPVIGTVARNQKGLNKLKDAIDDIAIKKVCPTPLKVIYSDEIEEKVSKLVPKIDEIFGGEIDSKWLALRILEGDKTLISSIEKYLILPNISDNIKEQAL